MSKNLIKVWDYYDVINGTSLLDLPIAEHPLYILTEAECVGGKEGILAFFFYKDLFCIASGDDGHWVLKYTCGKQWAQEIKRTILALFPS